MLWNQEKINEIYFQVRELAASSEIFRAELLQNPSVAIAKVAGIELPENFNIRIIENDPTYTATFVLPPLISGELSDEDLDNVAGGVTYDPNQSCGTKVDK